MPAGDCLSDRVYERMHETIMRAIANSAEVKTLLLEFEARGLIKDMAVMNLILSLDELSALPLRDAARRDAPSKMLPRAAAVS